MNFKAIFLASVSASLILLQAGCASQSTTSDESSVGADRKIQSTDSSSSKAEPVAKGLPRPMRSGGY